MPAAVGHHAVQDTFGRPLRNLRISVTDRCNLRCQYCMPETDYVWLPRDEILRFEELDSLVGLFVGLGVNKVRLTGGEPLLRTDLPVLVRLLAAHHEIEDLAMTTNGVRLGEEARALLDAGLQRVTVSLDTLRPERFKALTRRDSLGRVLEGLDEVRNIGFKGTKIDVVVLRGFNEDEIPDLLEYGKRMGAEVRFIEYMDVGGATRWSMEKVFPAASIRDVVARRYGSAEPVVEKSTAPAKRYRLPDGTLFGIIASTTAPFCSTCDRSRLTADGIWYTCLYAQDGLDLRGPLRTGVARDDIQALVASCWKGRTDRGAEERRQEAVRGVLVGTESLKQDPHLEMHTRGG